MKQIKRLTASCLVLALLCVGLGVWAVTGQMRIAKLNKQIQALSAPANTAAPDTIVAAFKGGVVTAAEAAGEYAMLASYYELLGQTEAEYAESAKQAVLEGLVEAKVLEQKAKELGVYTLSEAQAQEIEAQVQAEYEDNIRYYMEFRFDESKSDEEVRTETIEYLNESGLSYEEMLAGAQRNAWQERLFEVATANLNVSDAQLQEFYESQLASDEMTYSTNYAEYESDAEAGRVIVWNPQGVRRVQAIEVPFSMEQAVEYLSLQAAAENGDESSHSALDALYQSLEPAAQQLLNRLNAGEDFESLLTESGGSAIGCFVSSQSTLCGASFREAALALQKVGEVSGLVRTDGGISILRYAEDIPAGPVPFEAVKEALRPACAEEMKISSYNSTVLQWIADADVKYYPDRF